MGRPRTVHRCAAFFASEVLEIGYARLLQVIARKPSCVDFGFPEAVAGLDIGNFAVCLAPVPDRDGDAGENEMRSVARNWGVPDSSI